MEESRRRRVTVIGAGYVGLVTAVGLAELGHRVAIIETRADRADAIREGRSPIHEQGLGVALGPFVESGAITVTDRPQADADIVLVCVGTPIDRDGRSDLSQLRSALQSLGDAAANRTPIVVRSTTPPGSAGEMVRWAGTATSHLFTNPEFLRQGSAMADFRAPTRIVIGKFPDADPSALAAVTGLYDRLDSPLIVVDVTAAELIKNGANAFLALKLSFTNEMAALAEAYGTDIDLVLDGLSRDPRIGSAYMRPSFGFGGSCLPKELQALAVAGQARGLPMHVTIAASDANDAQQGRFAARIGEAVGGLTGRRIALLGLAFKGGTDDIRDSPALALAMRLTNEGAEVVAHDPQAAENARRALPGLVTVATVTDALAGADAAVIATDWPEYADLPWGDLRSRMRVPLVLDGRRLLDAAMMRALGYRYEAVGTASRRDDGPGSVVGESARSARGDAGAEIRSLPTS